MVPHGHKWSVNDAAKVVSDGRELSHMVQYDPRLFKRVPDDSRWSTGAAVKVFSDGLEQTQVVQSDPRTSQMALPKWSRVVPGGPW